MQIVSFLSVPATFWHAWHPQVVQVAFGVVALLMFATVLTRGHVLNYFWFTSAEQPLERLLVACTNVLACWSLIAMVLLLPIYIVGAEYYVYGEYNSRHQGVV